MQQGGSQYGVSPEMTPFSATVSRTQMLSAGTDQQKPGDGALAVEAASPISSLPPPPPRPGLGPSSANFDELVPVSGGFPDDDALAGDETERGVTGGNRWPRQETLALLKVRSEMDAVFRDATLKGPLWEDVSRKLAELGYNRSAKKCKEKFENVHKYYKRTKEGRAGRQDGKSYRFFSQLEALHSSSSNTAVPPMTHTTTITTTTTATAAAPASIGIVGPSARIQPPPISVTQTATTSQIGIARGGAPHDLGAAMATGISGSSAATAGISFSSDTSFSSSDSSDQDLEGGPSRTHSRKRKRGSRGGSSSRKMMAFFQGLMQQVMEKQEIMQQRFLETIEKREQDRMIREEAWKRQEMARLTREHELMAQERAISASRDAAVIAFLQKITGQAIQLQPPVTIPSAPPPQTVPAPLPPAPTPPPEHHHQPQQQQHHQQQQYHQQHHHHHHHQPQNTEITRHQPASSEVVIAVPEQQHPPAEEMGRGGSGSGSGGVSFDPTSSRWPKAEVLALIKLRSGLESRYQEAGPKGILWEEISAGMKRMGYNRSAKRCKEKWENINKYFKKVKESNKKRPEDAKTCPYFHQLDALYRKKILGSTSGSGGTSSSYATQNKQEQQTQQELVTMEPNPTANLQEGSDVLAIMPAPKGPSAQSNQTIKTENKNNNNGGNTEAQNGNGDAAPASLFGEGNISGGGGATTASGQKPEDIVKELIERQQHHHRPSITNDYDKLEEAGDSDNLEQEEEDEDDEDEEDGGEDESKLTYKIQLQRQNTGSSNGGGNAATSFMAMVQ